MHREADRRREGRLNPQPRPAGSVSGEPGAGPGTGESDKKVTFKKEKAEILQKQQNVKQHF